MEFACDDAPSEPDAPRGDDADDLVLRDEAPADAGAAPDVWRAKVAKYRALGMSVVGCEDQLAQYCAYEASMIACWRRGEEPSAASMNVLNKYASQFFETPSTQFSKQPTGPQQSEAENFWGQFKVFDGGKGAACEN